MKKHPKSIFATILSLLFYTTPIEAWAPPDIEIMKNGVKITYFEVDALLKREVTAYTDHYDQNVSPYIEITEKIDGGNFEYGFGNREFKDNFQQMLLHLLFNSNGPEFRPSITINASLWGEHLNNPFDFRASKEAIAIPVTTDNTILDPFDRSVKDDSMDSKGVLEEDYLSELLPMPIPTLKIEKRTQFAVLDMNPIFYDFMYVKRSIRITELEGILPQNGKAKVTISTLNLLPAERNSYLTASCEGTGFGSNNQHEAGTTFNLVKTIENADNCKQLDVTQVIYAPVVAFQPLVITVEYQKGNE